jgi:hypothetical protein
MSRKRLTTAAAVRWSLALAMAFVAVLATAAQADTGRFFSPASFWNRPAAPASPLEPGSKAAVGELVGEVHAELADHSGPWINTTQYSVPIYTVAADQPELPVRLISPDAAPALRSAWSAVPLPAGARPASGTDGHLVVWQPSSNRLWEFWRLRRGAGGWQAAWGGAIDDVSHSSGTYGSAAWPGATRWWGASASSLSIVGGLITFADLRRGRIDHALSISLPLVRKGVFAAPAKRTDGESTNPHSLPEGAHLRLNPKLDLAKLQLSPFTRMVAEAAQRYGIFVRDHAPEVIFDAQAPSSTGADPYAGAHGYFENKTPIELLSEFPWQRLQVLRSDLRRTP